MTSTSESQESTHSDASRLLLAVRQAGGFVWGAARKSFLLSLLGEAAAAASLAGVLLFGGQLVTKLAGDARIDEFGAVLPQVVGLGISLIIAGIASVAVRHLRWLVSEQVSRRVQQEIIGVTSSVDYQLYEQSTFHDLLDRSNNQASESSYQLVYDLLGLFNMFATSVVVILVLVRSVPEVLGALLLIGLPSVIAARASARLAFQATYELTPDDRLRHYLYGALTGKQEARELRVFGLGQVLRDRWNVLYDRRMQRIKTLIRRQVLFDGLAAAIAAVLVALVLLVLVEAAVDRRISLGDAAVAIVALQQLASRLRSAASASGSLRHSSLFLADFDRFLRLRPGGEVGAPASGDGPRGALLVEHVCFRYPGTETLVLDDVSLEIPPGKIVALVGVSGSGKTTLAHLVAGLYQPTAGQITVGGADIASIPRSAYWSSIAAVFQDFARYELTARENIAMGDATRINDLPAVRTAAGRAGIDRALERLSGGYETVLSRAYERGAELSVGQWQRVAVARAYFRDAPLLILDEPAAALDAIAEQELYERLVELCESRSTLLISHRFSTVRLADRICVMDEGRIVEQGTHAELMALGGRYAQMFNLQASNYLADPAAGLAKKTEQTDPATAPAGQSRV